MPLVKGTKLGAYEVVAAIGAGGMGEVYRARDTTLGRDVAIKTLPSSLALDPERLTRFEREARVLATLNHPHIAQIYGVEERDGVRALVLELVEGETLAERIAKGLGRGLSVAQAGCSADSDDRERRAGLGSRRRARGSDRQLRGSGQCHFRRRS